MGSMTIGAKYKTTLKDPGTPGVLRMVRATLPSRSPPSARPSLAFLLSWHARTLLADRGGTISLRDVPLLRAREGFGWLLRRGANRIEGSVETCR